ncbi:MAG: hypothetical protein SFY32_05290 [Bacteroidota bacterium]|nr:hypothetical protein [Bacteroidota bacterium]
MPSLKQIHVPIASPKQEQEVEIESENGKDVEIDAAKLAEHINAFARTRKAQDKILEFTLLFEKPFEMDKSNLKFILSNEIEDILLKEVRPLLIKYLFENTGAKFTIDSEIRFVETKKTVFSNTDKYKHLVNEYPLLEELKRRLGLELDY